MRRLADLPFLVVLMGIGALAMLLPAAFAYGQRDMHVARVFLYGALLFLMLTAIIGIASAVPRSRDSSRSHLLALAGVFVLLPVMLAVPFHQAVRDTSFLNAYFEMVSSLTTTGATLFDQPGRLSEAVHLWRALVGWLGGFLMWVVAISLLAPLELGGFELTTSEGGSDRGGNDRIGDARDRPERLVRHARMLLPIYIGLTLLLWLGLVLAGDRAFVAACHAMSALATSGISPVGGVQNGQAGLAGEALIFLMLILALTRRSFLFEAGRSPLAGLWCDPEFRLGMGAVLVLALLLNLRHWIAAFEVDEQENLSAALRALWGGIFTVMSFLTTTGFESADWSSTRSWSGLETTGLLLAGLALVGGGVGTTAGGVKLLRVIALYFHAQREIERMIYPSSVRGAVRGSRHIRSEGAYIAWVVFSLYALSVALLMVLLALAGLDFESASAFAIAAYTTTGPLAQMAGDMPLSYTALGDWAKAIVILAMVMGRLGTLALIALLNPDLWRR